MNYKGYELKKFKGKYFKLNLLSLDNHDADVLKAFDFYFDYIRSLYSEYVKFLQYLEYCYSVVEKGVTDEIKDVKQKNI